MATDVRSHKPSIFHVLDRLGYEVFKVESASALCPPAICPGARTRRPGVLARLAGGGRPPRFHKWLGAIRARSQPAFYFHHALIPHEPWIYLPSGRQNRPAGRDPIPDINHDVGFGDADLTDQNHLRHLLQVGYTDRLVGELLGRLERTGVLERALVVVTADHGYSFRVGVKSRRLANDENVEEIAPVPLFVKAPGQMERDVNPSAMRTLDLLATIADLLDTRVFYKQDGRSAYSREVRARRAIEVRKRDYSGYVRIGLPELRERRAARRRERAKLLGVGEESAVLYGDPWASAYRVGPRPELLGQPVGALGAGGVRAAIPAVATVAHRSLYNHVSAGSQVIPTRVSGSLRAVPDGEHRDLALAVNGRIRATSRSFDFDRAEVEYYSFQLPETVLRPGRNRLEIFELR
jgi:hypothetical protein